MFCSLAEVALSDNAQVVLHMAGDDPRRSEGSEPMVCSYTALLPLPRAEVAKQVHRSLSNGGELVYQGSGRPVIGLVVLRISVLVKCRQRRPPDPLLFISPAALREIAAKNDGPLTRAVHRRASRSKLGCACAGSAHQAVAHPLRHPLRQAPQVAPNTKS